ncbi:substrate-binding domain-containing protein [Streptosporangium soli]|nr:substrate-binding domain-containing protein [Streptosporangium sp. KLBMP 9127]
MPSQERTPARRERKKAETRRAIADAARRLFAERGFDAVTVMEIAEAADVSTKTVFNYFPAKEQLFFAHEPLLASTPAAAVRERPPGESAVAAVQGCLRAPDDGAGAPDAGGRAAGNDEVRADGPDGPSAENLAAYARVFRDSATLRSYGRDMFAEHERALAEALAADRERPADGPSPEVMAALLLSPLRRVWESLLIRMAAGEPPGEAVALGLRELDAAYLLLRRGITGPAQEPPRLAAAGRLARPSPEGHAGADGEPVAPPLGGTRAPGRGERPSITRVAELARVSATTVSHTLNGRRPVAEETRRRVLDAIDRLGYRPNVLARGLRTSRSQTIGLVIPDITNPFYPALARGLQDVLGPAGYDQIISNTDGERPVEQDAIEQMIARQVDGLAFAVFHTHAEDLRPAIEAGIPVVRLGGRLVQEGVDVVHSDDEGGSAEATGYLLARGYRRIGFVCGPAAEGPAAERVAGYRSALVRAGADAGRELVVHTHFSRAGGAEGAARLLGLSRPPDAVLCANDIMAIGALGLAKERGLRVPGDLAVMGFDDIEAAGLVSPGLTTMANPAREIGQACARRLLDRLRGAAAGPYSEEIIPARLVRRASA